MDIVEPAVEPTPKVTKNPRQECFYCKKAIIKKNMSTHLKVCKVKNDEIKNPLSLTVLDNLRKENEQLKVDLMKSNLKNEHLQEFIDSFMRKIQIDVKMAN